MCASYAVNQNLKNGMDTVWSVNTRIKHFSITRQTSSQQKATSTSKVVF